MGQGGGRSECSHCVHTASAHEARQPYITSSQAKILYMHSVVSTHCMCHFQYSSLRVASFCIVVESYFHFFRAASFRMWTAYRASGRRSCVHYHAHLLYGDGMFCQK